jgi:hypothetical protein
LYDVGKSVLQEIIYFNVLLSTTTDHLSFGYGFATTDIRTVCQEDTRPFSANDVTTSRISTSLLFEQRLSLSILVDNGTTLEGILANETREADQDGEDKQDTHDDKGEDPLESDDVGEELGDTES